ncbi:hypothetical protein [Methylobacterium iners]|uniref:Translation initiation factor 2 n=1 Tax=Methylobacterium iners TaxID=418707 RepID=A0ABQ4S2N5_9HYPH|nr:hypothetical protein [Methylobacterium iners]GJD97141.1 hypothetical protein OCOJLMKI_4369 [Methylobacterium iners]
MKPPTSNVDPTGQKGGTSGQGPGKGEAGTGAAKITPAGPATGGVPSGEPAGPATTRPATGGAEAKPEPAKGTGTSQTVPPAGAKADAPKVEPAKVDLTKSDPAKPEPTRVDAAKAAATKPEPVKAEADNPKAETPKPGPGPQPTSRPAGTVEDGPIIDLKAKRLNDPATAPKSEAAKASSPAADKAAPLAGPAAPAKARGPGFGSVAAAGLLGGVIGAGLLFAVERAGVLPPRGEDPRLAALDQRINALAPRDALAALDKRIAANETALKPLPDAVRGAETIAREALQKAGVAPSPAAEGAAPGAPAPSLPPDLMARLDSLDQRVSALQEEPGREPPSGGQVTAVPAGGDLAGLDQRLKALEAKLETARPADAQPDLGARLAALQGDIESRTKANAEADQALGEKLAGLQKSLDARVQAATEAIQSATEASRLATEAGKARTEDAAKAVERQLQAQAQQIAGLDKAVAGRAEASTVQAALRVVSADRIAAALESGAPYADALAALRSMEPGDPGSLTALAVFADRGAPTARSLAAEFRPIAERIAAARKAAQAKSVAESGDIAKRFASMAESIVQVRRVDAPAAGEAASGPDPSVKVQEALDRGAVGEAAQAFAALPEDVRAQAGEFGTKLKSRAAAAEAAQALLSDTFKGEAFKGLAAPAAR